MKFSRISFASLLPVVMRFVIQNCSFTWGILTQAVEIYGAHAYKYDTVEVAVSFLVVYLHHPSIPVREGALYGIEKFWDSVPSDKIEKNHETLVYTMNQVYDLVKNDSSVTIRKISAETIVFLSSLSDIYT